MSFFLRRKKTIQRVRIVVLDGSQKVLGVQRGWCHSATSCWNFFGLGGGGLKHEEEGEEEKNRIYKKCVCVRSLADLVCTPLPPDSIC